MRLARSAVHCLRAALLSAIGLFQFTTALALPADITLDQLYHSQWTVQDGAPSGIEAIAQTRDGYIWLSAGGRLFRFDGVEFEHIDRLGSSVLPPEKVFAIWARPEGGLWISYQYGGATFIGDEGVHSYFMTEGLPPNSIRVFAEDGSGGMWAGTTRGLLRLEAGRWAFVSDAWNIPLTDVTDASLDRDGTLWVLTLDGLFYLRRGSQRFEAAGLRLGINEFNAALISSPDGLCWLAQAARGLTRLRTPARNQSVVAHWSKYWSEIEHELPAMLIDRHSNLWLSSSGNFTRVSLHFAEQAAAESSHTRLAGEHAGPLLEDREGNVWLTSSSGLDKFRTSAFTKLPLLRGRGAFGPAIATQENSVWVATLAGDLSRFADGQQRDSLRLPAPWAAALHLDGKGTLWVGGSASSIWHRQADRWMEWRPDDATSAGGIQAITSASDGTLWVSIVRSGVYRVVRNHWTLWGDLADLPREPATTLAFDSVGRLWLGYVNNRVALVDRGRVTLFDASDGLSTGAVQVTAVRGRNLWIGGERGVNWFDGQRFHRVVGEQQRAFTQVNGIAEQTYGDLWLNTSEGAVLIPAAEVRKFVGAPSNEVQFRLFDYLDGMPGAPTRIRPLPTIAESGDGRLWFSSTDGVVSLASGWLASNPLAPNVLIKSISVDGQNLDVESSRASPLQLPSNPRVLQIAYTALSFTIPERVKFKYRLEGTDMGWQDVGTRREVQFTGLTPGSYRFQVIASNDSGVWNQTGAAVELIVPPTFLQSRKFFALSVATACALLWLLFLLRMRQVKAHLQSRSEERLMERERIARELHDTFLQGVQGLMLRFQSATDRIPEGQPARQLMEDALDRADRVLAEGRDKVAELRDSIDSNLLESLTLVGGELSRDYAIAFQSEIDGAQRELNPLVQEEAYRLGCEALTNAFRHSKATRIVVTVQFGLRYFVLRVVDDGSGFDVSNCKPGRWGLKGMRERAERVRGRFTLSSAPGTGTTVELHVAARLAYRRYQRGRWAWLNRFRGSGIEDQV